MQNFARETLGDRGGRRRKPFSSSILRLLCVKSWEPGKGRRRGRNPCYDSHLRGINIPGTGIPKKKGDPAFAPLQFPKNMPLCWNLFCACSVASKANQSICSPNYVMVSRDGRGDRGKIRGEAAKEEFVFLGERVKSPLSHRVAFALPPLPL